MLQPGKLTLRVAREEAQTDAEGLLTAVDQRAEAHQGAHVFIERVSLDGMLRQLERQRQRLAKGANLPLFGVPFAVKDNIDVEGLSTTAGCPAFAYRPEVTAPAVAKLLGAGAILVGKTNLDQFATGLVGVRSPYGACRSALSHEHISGGSSSGSALAVALGVAAFSLGTDTAGSGRVPAAFNGVVGLKPTRGKVSTRGIVPACRSLDCVSIFAHVPGEAGEILDIMAGPDAEDPFSRAGPPVPVCPGERGFRFGVPAPLDWCGDSNYEALFSTTVARLTALGGVPVPVDAAVFVEAGQLLYGGPWVAERYAAVGSFIECHPSDVHPVVSEIILGGKAPRAVDLFRAMYRLEALRQQARQIFSDVDAVLFPMTPTIYTVEDVLREPKQLNSNLGLYTNFVNLLDLAGVALPAGVTPVGLPFGVTLLGPAFSEALLLAIAERTVE